MFFPIAFYQGRFLPLENISLNPTDLGFQRGYSIFDFFKLKNYANPWLDWYLERLQHSCTTVGIALPYSLQEIKELAIQLLHENQKEDGYIKILISAGNSDNGYSPSGQSTILILGVPVEPRNKTIYNEGAHLLLSNYQRDIPGVKSTNYLQSTMLTPKMKREHAVDVLYFKDDLITEASRCNFFLVGDKEVYTPGANVLKGITRRRILSIPNPPVPIIEKDIHISDLQTAREAFISSTTKGVLPITSVGTITIGNGKAGVITKELMNHINAF